MVYFFSLVTAFYITVTLVPVIRRLALHFRIVDNPGIRKIHSSPVPRAGGIALLFGIAVPSLLWIPMDRRFLGFLAGLVIISIFGLLDDLYQLSYRIKFLGQLLAAVVTMALGGFFIRSLGIWAGNEVTIAPAIGVLLTILFILGVTNAINLSDGLDGLAGGICMLIFGCIAALAYWQNETQITLAALALFGAILAFLRYNTYPANIFMGDTGSQVLGFSAAVLSLYLTHCEQTPLSRALPLLIIGFPIIDTLSVMTIRILSGSSPFKADKTHFHHKLLALTGSQIASVVIIYLIQSIMAVLSLILQYQTASYVVFVYIAIVLSIPFILGILYHFKAVILTGIANLRDKSTRISVLRGNTTKKGQYSILLLKYVFSIGLFWLALSIPENLINWECSFFLLLFLSLILFYLFNKIWYISIFRYSIFIVGVYLLFSTQGAFVAFTNISVRYFQYAYYGMLTIILLFYLTITKFGDLKISSVDYLILVLIGLVSFLPLEKHQLYQMQLSTVALIILLWTTEILLKNTTDHWNPVTLSSLASMFYIGAKGFGVLL